MIGSLLITFLATILLRFLYYQLKFRNKIGTKTLGGPQPDGTFSAPGPCGLPLLGNVLQMNSQQPHLTLSEWARQYGAVCRVKFFNVPWIVLNSYETIHEALVGQGEAFGGRPKLFRFEYASAGYSDIACADSASETWRRLRRCAQKSLRQFGEGLDRIEAVVGEFGEELLQAIDSFGGRPVDPHDLLHSFTMKTIYYTLMGNKFTDEAQLGKIMYFEKTYAEGMGPTGDGVALDVLPWLRYLGNKSFRKLTEANRACAEFWQETFPVAKEQYSDGDRYGVVHHLIQLAEDCKLEGKEGVIREVNIKEVFFDLIGAGVITTTATVYSLILILVHYENIARKLHEEVDTVVGESRKVALSDRDKMPYTRATIYELLRYSSVVSLSFPHATQSDVTLDGGIFIPAGTNVAPNLWFLHHDESFWGDPFEFRPERFLSDDGTELLPADHENRKHLMPFGAGTRVCVGEVFAMSRLFLITAMLLQRYRFLPGDNKNGVSCDPRTWKMDLLLNPPSYTVRMIPRK